MALIYYAESIKPLADSPAAPVVAARPEDTPAALPLGAIHDALAAWFEANAYPIEGGIAVFFRDISQRRRAEEEREALLGRLEYEHTLLEAVVKQLPIGLIVAEAPGGKVLLHHEAARARLGEAVETLPDDAPLPASASPMRGAS